MMKAIPEAMRSAFERTGHPFHMWESLATTPEALQSVLDDEVQTAVARAATAVRKASQIHLVGCGSSLFSAMAGAYAFNGLTDVAASAWNAFEFAAYPPAQLGRAALVAISHTGGTAAVCDAVRVAGEKGAPTIGLTDMPASPLATAVQHPILGGGGREPALPKTKSYVASLLRQYLLAVRMADLEGRETGPYRKALMAAPEAARQVLEQSLPLARQLAQTRKSGTKVFLIGGGPHMATAQEGALKLQEAVQVPAHAWELEEGMHGPWVIMEPDDLVIMIGVRGPSMAKVRGVVDALQAVGPEIWAITDDPAAVSGADHVTLLPAVPEIFSPLYAVLPLYHLTYQLALTRGQRPDAMRFLDQRYLEARLSLPR